MAMSNWSSRFRSVDKIWSALETGLALVCGVGVLFFLVFTTSEVAARYFFVSPIPGHVELMELMAAGVLLVAVSYSEMRKVHVRVDVFLIRLKGRLYHRFEALFSALALMPIALFAVYGFKQTFITLEVGRITGILHLPQWPFMMLASIGFSVLLIRLIIHLIQHIIASMRQESEQSWNL